jgi:hypothetical protein
LPFQFFTFSIGQLVGFTHIGGYFMRSTAMTAPAATASAGPGGFSCLAQLSLPHQRFQHSFEGASLDAEFAAQTVETDSSARLTIFKI